MCVSQYDKRKPVAQDKARTAFPLLLVAYGKVSFPESRSSIA